MTEAFSAEVQTFVGLCDRVVGNLHASALTITKILNESNRLDERVIEGLNASIQLLEHAIQDIHTATFVGQQPRPSDPQLPSIHPRYLVRIEDEAVIAYADDGHDFRRVHDDTVWAHDSDGTLLSARSGTPIARRSGSIYYDTVTDIPLYYETT